MLNDNDQITINITFINIPGIIKDPLWNGKSYHNIYLHQQALQQANENGKIIDHHQRHIFVSIITSLRNKLLNNVTEKTNHVQNNQRKLGLIHLKIMSSAIKT